jgi:formamidopyrimidine-DNA glycosylase
MPELPEVETLSRQLQKEMCGSKILATEVYDNKLNGIKNLKTGRIVRVVRRGKTIDIQLDDGNSLLIHLRMTGRLLWQESAERPKHSRWKMNFRDGNIFLIDPRRFATVKVERGESEKIVNDLLTGFDEKKFMKTQARRKVHVKILLMDPKAVAGIGNIYACEILHGAGIHPGRITATLAEDEWEKIFYQAKEILKVAIKKRGTSISDWRDLYGRKGANQHELKVYGREEKICSACGSIIVRIKQGGRSTFYCPGCQK